ANVHIDRTGVTEFAHLTLQGSATRCSHRHTTCEALCVPSAADACLFLGDIRCDTVVAACTVREDTRWRNTATGRQHVFNTTQCCCTKTSSTGIDTAFLEVPCPQPGGITRNITEIIPCDWVQGAGRSCSTRSDLNRHSSKSIP